MLVGAAYRSGSGCAPNGDVDYDAAVFEIELGTVPTDLFPQLRPGSVLLALLVTSAAAAGVVTESLGQQSPARAGSPVICAVNSNHERDQAYNVGCVEFTAGPAMRQQAAMSAVILPN